MIVSIQALRAVAAWMVVLRHVEQFMFGQPTTFLSWLFWSKGAAGVEIFFVISGFIMVVSCRDVTPGQFMARRLTRVAPVYWLATLAMFLISPADWAVLAQSLTFTRSVFSYGYPVLYVGWTLEYELAFYVLFALGIGRWWFLPLALIALQFSPLRSPLMLLFLAGYGLGYGYVKGYLPRFRVLGWWLLGLGIALIAQGTGRDAYWWSAGAVCIVWAALCFDLKGEAWVKLGDQSYAVYLIHPIIIAVALRWTVTPGLIIGVLVAVAAGSWLVHTRLERPVTRWAVRAYRSDSRITATT